MRRHDQMVWPRLGVSWVMLMVGLVLMSSWEGVGARKAMGSQRSMGGGRQASEEMGVLDFTLTDRIAILNLEDLGPSESDSVRLTAYSQEDQGLWVSQDGQSAEDMIKCAEVSYHKTIKEIGWDKLSVETFEGCDPVLQMYAAGFLEGFTTHQSIRDFHHNQLQDSEEHTRSNIFDYFRKTKLEMLKRIQPESLQRMSETDRTYWTQMGFLVAQLTGMQEGYNQARNEEMTFEELLYVNSDGYLPELEQIFEHGSEPAGQSTVNGVLLKRPKIDQMSKDQLRSSLMKKFNTDNYDDAELLFLSKLRCSALLKTIKDDQGKIQDVYVGHATWDGFTSLTRSYKHYKFANQGKDFSESEITFSSYPGCITSTDDFYITNNGLVVTETTLGMYEPSIFADVKPSSETVPDGFRIQMASRISTTANEWIDWMNHVQTGTYNSQWMILDTKKARESVGMDELQPGTFTVMEQAVQQTVVIEGTDFLNQHGYWASYNQPFTQEVSDASGRSKADGFGQYFQTDNAPRAQIFRARQSTVKDLGTMAAIMRWNEWDSSSNEKGSHNPAEQIAARYDLSHLKIPVGATDAKFTTLDMSQNLQSYAIAGPSTQNGNLEPFSWEKTPFNGPEYADKHDGTPQTFDFPWTQMTPQTIDSGASDPVFQDSS